MKNGIFSIVFMVLIGAATVSTGLGLQYSNSQHKDSIITDYNFALSQAYFQHQLQSKN